MIDEDVAGDAGAPPTKALRIRQLVGMPLNPDEDFLHQVFDRGGIADPDNVHELQNVIERAMIVSMGATLRLDLPKGTPSARARVIQTSETVEVVPDADMKRHEHANLLAALEQTGGRISGPDGAAELLGLRPTTLASRVKKLALDETS